QQALAYDPSQETARVEQKTVESIRQAGDGHMPERVGEQLGNYRLLRLLGRGNFAEVYLGEHVHLKSHAALKLLHVRLSEEDVGQFEREAQTLAGLSHPHIVRVLDFAMQEATPFLVM